VSHVSSKQIGQTTMRVRTADGELLLTVGSSPAKLEGLLMCNGVTVA
jgi:hypothetical protein